jgi:hypothetical protein
VALRRCDRRPTPASRRDPRPRCVQGPRGSEGPVASVGSLTPSFFST